MSKTVSVRISHQLGREEALRRLRSGITDARSSFGDKISTIDETWRDNHLDFRVGAMGQAVTGSMDVEDDHVALEFVLTGVLALLSGKIKNALQTRGVKLLDHR